jgi:hypothetical protein
MILRGDPLSHDRSMANGGGHDPSLNGSDAPPEAALISHDEHMAGAALNSAGFSPRNIPRLLLNDGLALGSHIGHSPMSRDVSVELCQPLPLNYGRYPSALPIGGPPSLRPLPLTDTAGELTIPNGFSVLLDPAGPFLSSRPSRAHDPPVFTVGHGACSRADDRVPENYNQVNAVSREW